MVLNYFKANCGKLHFLATLYNVLHTIVDESQLENTEFKELLGITWCHEFTCWSHLNKIR